MMKSNKTRWLAAGLVLTTGLVVGLIFTGNVMAHKSKHSLQTMADMNTIFMEEVTFGDRLFHGDPAAAKEAKVTLSKTGMACAMCHPFASDTHPQEFPKFQEQIGDFATLREMTNWCIEKPNQGQKIDPNGRAMKALEAYMYWSNRGSTLDPGRH